MDLTIRDRRKRVILVAQHILASNVCLPNMEKDGMDYLKNNISLAKDVSVYLDAITFFIIQYVTITSIKEVYNGELNDHQLRSAKNKVSRLKVLSSMKLVKMDIQESGRN